VENLQENDDNIHYNKEKHTTKDRPTPKYSYWHEIICRPFSRL